MSKEPQFTQLTIYDALAEIGKRYDTLNQIKNKLSKKFYAQAFADLNKRFVNDEISLDGFKDCLHTLLEQYRKDYKNGYEKKTK